MTKELTPQFSRRVLLISLIFLLANLGIYGLRFLVGQPDTLRSVAPKLVSARIEDIEVKSPYDEDYLPAQPGQEIFSGSVIRTGEAEFAELILDGNIIQLDERTEVRLSKNNFSGVMAYAAETPRLELELLSGSVWVDAFDMIQVCTQQGMVKLTHSVAVLTYSAPINRLMVVTGAADLSLLNADREELSDLVVPLHNQVTFVDSQITENYAALKPSKLKKELKMTPIAPELLADEWILRNTNHIEQEKEAFSKSLITSKLSYQIRSGYQKVLSYITFLPEARRTLALEKARMILAYILGGVESSKGQPETQQLISEFNSLVAERKNDPELQNMIVETLFAIEYSRSGTPTYLLKEALMEKVARNEGVYVYSIYLDDLRRALYEGDIQASEIIAGKWMAAWEGVLSAETAPQFNRQAQILNNTILSYAGTVTSPVLDVFDRSGEIKMEYSSDTEESRSEIASDRLQIAASLISQYRYLLAKQYLKNSYLSLDIENLSPDLASTKVFLETGKLLAQRIEYAEDVLHGAAMPIDETKFRDYFQTVKRDESLSADLRKFFDLDNDEAAVTPAAEAPTAAQVAEKFLDSRINVNYADISLRPASGFYYQVMNARLIDRGPQGKALSFDATYDFVSNSVTDVVADGRKYQGSFTLDDIVTLLKTGGNLESRVPAPKLEEGIELLITDQEKLEAQEGQAIAQDVARQLAYNQLSAVGITIPNVKLDIGILDELNLNRFYIEHALIDRVDKEGVISIRFNYNTTTGKASKITSEEGVLLFEELDAKSLVKEVLTKTVQLERELAAVRQLTDYASENALAVEAADIEVTEDYLLVIRSITLVPLSLTASGLYDPATKTFLSATNKLLSAKNIDIKDYFTQLAQTYIIQYMNDRGFSITANQVASKYPFEKIQIAGLQLGEGLYNFELLMGEEKVLNVKREGSKEAIEEMTLEELRDLPAQTANQES